MKKFVRIITLAPIMAFLALTILYLVKPYVFRGQYNYIITIVFLTIFPLLAYPLQPFIPSFKDQGRDGQRKLAIVAAVVGYVLGIVYAVAFSHSSDLLLIYLMYLVSGLVILVTNKIIKIKASGHACGVVGPVVYLWHFIGRWAALGGVFLVAVYWASLKMKRHTWAELALGSIIPIFAFYVSNILLYVINI